MVNARGPVHSVHADASRLGTNEGGAGLEPLFELFEIRGVTRLRKQASLKKKKKKNPTTVYRHKSGAGPRWNEQGGIQVTIKC